MAKPADALWFRDVAPALNVSHRTVQRAKAAGKLRVRVDGDGRWCVTRAEFERIANGTALSRSF